MIRLSQKFGKMKICLSVALGIACNYINAQTVQNYTFSQSQGTYQDIQETVLGTGVGDVGTDVLDTNTWTVQLPFAFTFNSTAYNEVNVHAKGYLSFGNDNVTSSSPISSGTRNYQGVISAFGGDILSANPSSTGENATVSYEIQGTAPSRKIIFQYKHFRFYASTPRTADDFEFQIVLHENGKIDFVYDIKSTNLGFSNRSVMVGLRGTSNTDYNSRIASGTSTSNWNTTEKSSANTGKIFFNNSTLPQSGLTFTYTPTTDAMSVNDIDKNKVEVITYPNPVKNKLYIKAKNLENVAFYDSLGRNVLQSDKNVVNVDTLPSGVYNIVIKSNKETTSKKIIKE